MELSPSLYITRYYHVFLVWINIFSSLVTALDIELLRTLENNWVLFLTNKEAERICSDI